MNNMRMVEDMRMVTLSLVQRDNLQPFGLTKSFMSWLLPQEEKTNKTWRILGHSKHISPYLRPKSALERKGANLPNRFRLGTKKLPPRVSQSHDWEPCGLLGMKEARHSKRMAALICAPLSTPSKRGFLIERTWPR